MTRDCRCSHPSDLHNPTCRVQDCACTAFTTAKPRKYRNVPVEIDGIRYDSKAEARRGEELRLLERAGAIANLQRQQKYPLLVNGQRVAAYISDFEYDEVATGRHVVEDVKGGVKTPLYRLKARLMRACWGIEIREVQA